jgi:flagellar assembly protein FliH
MSSKNRVIKSDRQPKDVESFVLPTEEEYVHSLAVEGLQNKKGAHLKGRPRPGGIKGADSGASRELSEEAERIVSEARMQAEEIRTEAHQKGYAEGAEKGRKEEGAALSKVIAGFQRSLEELARLREHGIKDNELEIVELALEVARKIIGSELASDPMTVAKVVRNALSHVRVKESLRVRLNPEDHALLSQGTPEFLEAVTLVADPGIERGGAVIESSGGNLDAQIEEQLAEIEKSLKKGVVSA